MSAECSSPSPPPAAPDGESGYESCSDPARVSGEEAGGTATMAAALDAAFCLGAWAHDMPADRLSLAPRLGERLGLATEERAGVPLARVLGRLHDEDRPHVAAMLAAARETGGLFEAEFRTSAGRGTHFLRLTGRAETDPSGRTVRTHGLAFDLTEMRLGLDSSPLQAQWRINQFAGHVIALKGLVAALGNPSLARLLDRMAVETGFELARHLGQAPGGAPH